MLDKIDVMPVDHPSGIGTEVAIEVQSKQADKQAEPLEGRASPTEHTVQDDGDAGPLRAKSTPRKGRSLSTPTSP